MSEIRIEVDDLGAWIDVPAGAAWGALVIESGRGGWLRLVLDGQTLAWARTLGFEGWAWALAPRSTPLTIVSPITAREARSVSLRAADPPRWPHRFAQALARSDRTWLRPGTWRVVGTSRRAPTASEHARGVTPDEVLTHERNDLPLVVRGVLASLDAPVRLVERWRLSGSGRVVLLRSLSDPSAARVRSWRKHARDGTLPPILVGFVAPLDAWVLLDGHDRLLAARLEGTTPDVIALHGERRDAPPVPDEARARWQAEASERHAKAFAHEHRLSDRSRREANAALVRAFDPAWFRRTWTPARFRADLHERAVREFAALDLPDDVRHAFRLGASLRAAAPAESE